MKSRYAPISPVGFLTYRKDDRVAYAVMNGSTGKITADLPVDKKKYILGSILLAVPIFAVLAFLITMTGQMVLTASSVLALVSLVIYGLELSAISDKDSHADDKGFAAAGRSAGSSGSPDAGDKKAEKGVLAAIRKYGKYALLFLVVLLVFPRLGLDYLTGSGNLTGFKIYGAVSVILLFGALVFIWALADSETAKKNMVLQIAGSVIAVGASAAILVWNPVSDHGSTAARSLPRQASACPFWELSANIIFGHQAASTFYDRKGGNDRAK